MGSLRLGVGKVGRGANRLARGRPVTWLSAGVISPLSDIHDSKGTHMFSLLRRVINSYRCH